MYSQLNAVYEQYKNIDKNNDFCIEMKEHNLDSFIEFLERSNNYSFPFFLPVDFYKEKYSFLYKSKIR